MKFSRVVMGLVVLALMSCATHTASKPREVTEVRMLNQCKTVRDMPVAIDQDEWTDVELKSIIAALKVWTYGTGGRLHWVSVTDENLERALILEKIEPNVLGYHAKRGNLISLMPSRSANEKVFAGVVIHEVGHALGLAHNDKNTMTFMHANMGDVPPSLLEHPQLPEADIEAYWAMDKCSLFDEPWGGK